MFSNELNNPYQRRREVVFLILSGFFLGSLTMLNILGLSKVIEIPFFGMTLPLTMGVLPYPITFLCTDFISEIYGRKHANTVVWVGLALNLWIVFIVWLGSVLPPHTQFYTETGQLIIPETIHGAPNLSKMPLPGYVFYEIKNMTMAATFGSMLAYLLAQFVDVHIFHALKRFTKGKHLWLRNNGSTLISQLVDSFAVILIAHYTANAFQLKDNPAATTILLTYILTGYGFKFIAALLDTIPFYIGTKWLTRYLGINPNEGYE